MLVKVITPPEPFVTPADIPGKHAGDDAFVTLMIEAATGNIDGPNGWLGRAIGEQTLELTSRCWDDCDVLPYPPLIEVEEVDVDGAPVGVDEWGVAARGQSVRVRYRAGYTDEVPAPLRAAVILMTVGYLAIHRADGGLRSFEVQGAFTKQFNSPEMADRVRTDTVKRLLAPFRVFA